MGLDFTTGPVMPLLIRFFTPFLLANILNSLYNTIDTIIIGQFVGSAGIVSVTMGGKMLNLFAIIGTAFAGGGQTLIAQLTGAKRKDDVREAIGTLFSFMLILSVITACLIIIFARPLLGLFNTPQESMADAIKYTRITSIGLPLMFGYTAVSAVLRGMGDSKHPLMFIGIAAAFNLIGDLVFVAAFNMSAAGTALATVMGQGLSLICSLVLLYRHKETFGFDFKLRSFKIIKEKMIVIAKIGFPMALRGLFIQVTQLFLMGQVNKFGIAESAAYSIGDKVYHLSNIFVMAVAQGGAGMIAQNVGAEKRERVKPIMRSTLLLACGFAAVLSVFSLLFPDQIYSLFTSDTDVIVYAKVFMRISCLIFFVCAFMGTYDGVVTGTGAAILSFIGGFLDGVLFRVCFSLLFAYVLNWGIAGFFMGEALARLGPIIVGAVYYHSGAWLKKKKLM